MITSPKALYRKLPPVPQHQIQALLLKGLRLLGKLKVLPRPPVCNRYIAATAINSATIAWQHNPQIQLHRSSEESAAVTRPAIFLPHQALEPISPLKAKTETIVLELSDRRFSFRNNHLIDPQLNVIGEANIHYQRLPIYKQLLAQPIPRSGTIAYLSNPDPGNYYHWLCRTLPLLRIYQTQFDFRAIDFFYVGQFPLRPFHYQSLKQAGITPAQLIQQACTSDRLLAAISSRAQHFGAAPITPQNYQYSRSLFEAALSSQPGHKRLYVQRGNVKRRQVINEAQVIALLSRFGFEPVTMEGRSIEQQASLFNQAEAIVALHGAALTNLLFIQPDTRVIELLPQGYTNSCFYALANYAQANYYYLQGEKLPQQADRKRHDLDLLVDIEQLNQICQLAGL